MKSPEYVATVTRIYRKYIDLALSDNEYKVDENDRKKLMQVFNRGMSSSGHLKTTQNRDLVFKEKPNNMGLFLGTVTKFNQNKGHITLTLNEPIAINDTISLENETGTYTVSELMDEKHNIVETKEGQTVTIGRMKGNIKSGDKVYKISSKELLIRAKESYRRENIKIPLECKITIKKGIPISLKVTSLFKTEPYKNLQITCTLEHLPEEAISRPLDEEIIIKQLSKTSSTPYEFKNIKINMEDNVFLPKLSSLNELRRTALENVEQYATSKISRLSDETPIETKTTLNENVIDMMREFSTNSQKFYNYKISLLLNILNLNLNYSDLNNVDEIYIPLKYFTNSKYTEILTLLSKKADIYVYMPTITKSN